jgi:hypothetical protein
VDTVALAEGGPSIFGGVLAGVGSSLLSTAAAHPVLATFIVLVFTVGIVDKAHAALLTSARRDPDRLFSRADKAVVLARAGHQCEHHGLLGRCDAREALQADHVHPYSRGGWTAPANGQALCKRHNREKSARVPWGWQLRRLARRRAGYFPPGQPTAITRTRPRR